MAPFCSVGFKSNLTLIDYFNKLCAAVVLAGHHCQKACVWVGVYVSLLIEYRVPSYTKDVET